MIVQRVSPHVGSAFLRAGAAAVFILSIGAAVWATPGDSAGGALWASWGAGGGWLASGVLLIACGVWHRRAVREERRRKQAESMLRHVADIIPFPLFVKDAQGRFLLINKAYTLAYGTEMAVCCGKTLPQVDNFMTPEKRLDLHNRDMEYIREGGSRNVESAAVYITGEIRQGQYQAMAFPLDAERQVRGLVGFFNDQTESIQLIRELHRVNKLTSMALELAQAGDWRVIPDKNGDFVVSELGRAILGDSPEEEDPCLWHMQDWQNAVVAADADQAQQAVQSHSGATSGIKTTYDETYQFRRPMDGRLIWIHDRGMFERDQTGAVIELRGVIQDITRFKQAESDAREAKLALERESRARTEFLVNMSHELRTPMSGILGMSHLVLQSTLPPMQQGYVRAIEVSGQILQRILSDILEYAKIESGGLFSEQIDFPPRQMLEHVLTPMMIQAEEKGVAFHLHLDNALPAMITGDSDRLGQVLGNLVDNAIKSAERGVVAVRADLVAMDEAEHRLTLHFSVHDNGTSLTESELRQLFTPFSQSDGTSTRYGGTRLGLAISKRLVELQGGTLEAASESEEGNTFTFTLSFGLPASEEQGGQTEFSREHMLQVLNGAKVLLVEDNEINQIVVNDMLTRLGVRVHIAGDGMQAVEMIRDGDYDVVLMDIQMPVMDGFEATQLLRAESRFADLPIIALTAHAMPEDRQLSLSSGMNDHLAKPIDPEALFTTLARWLRKK